MGTELADEEVERRLAALEPKVRLYLRFATSPALARRAELDDLTQETLLRVYAARAAWPYETPSDAALYGLAKTIARHTLIDAARALRARRREADVRALVSADYSRLPAGAAPSPRTLAAGREFKRHLETAFATLSKNHQRVLCLRQLEGLSAAETGLRLGLSERAVHSLFRRALEAWEAAAR